MGRALEVAWEEGPQELHEPYKNERDIERRKRAHASWLLRSGRSPPAAAAELAGVGKNAPWSAGFLGTAGAGSRRC